jgi:ABC-type sugar transport system ATPase subunit
MIYGALRKTDQSEIFVKGSKASIKSPEYAVRNHMGFVSENRKTEGLILKNSIFKNIALLPIVKQKSVLVSAKGMKDKILDVMNSLSVKYSDIEQDVQSLSGGNQQKCVLAKWLSVETEILILDQPTRGVDVGAKEEIYRLVDRLAKNGAAILYISDELEELYSLCDRIIIMRRGEQFAELDNSKKNLTKVEILSGMITDKGDQSEVLANL